MFCLTVIVQTLHGHGSVPEVQRVSWLREDSSQAQRRVIVQISTNTHQLINYRHVDLNPPLRAVFLYFIHLLKLLFFSFKKCLKRIKSDKKKRSLLFFASPSPCNVVGGDTLAEGQSGTSSPRTEDGLSETVGGVDGGTWPLLDDGSWKMRKRGWD